MALISLWENRPTAIPVNKYKQIRRYRVGEADDFIDWEETTVTQTEEYHGLNITAAMQAFDLDEQPTDGTTNSWNVREVNRTIGAYVVTKTNELKVLEQVGAADAPLVGSVIYSVPQNTNVSSWPISLQLTTGIARATIRYRIDSANSAGNIVNGAWQESSGSSVTISLNTSTLAGGASVGGISYHKYVRVVAEAKVVQQTGEVFIGGQSSQIYAQRAPILGNASFSRGSGVVTSWPVSVTLSGAAGSTIEYQIQSLNNQNQYVVTSNGTVSTGNNLNVNTTTLAGGAGSAQGVTAHKAVVLFARQRVTLDGINYFGPWTSIGLAQSVPSVSAPFIGGGGSTDELTVYGTLFNSFNITISGSNVSYAVNHRTSTQSWTGFRDRTGFVEVSSGSGQNNPSVQISRPSMSWDFRSSTPGCARGSSYRSLRVDALSVASLDGINYGSAQVTRWFTEQIACYNTINPPW